MKSKKKFETDYAEWRRKQLIEDNKKESQNIKKLSRKLGLHNRKPRKDGTQKLPAWMRDSGLDYLFEYEKYDEKSSNSFSEEKIIGGSNIKKSIICEYCHLSFLEKSLNIYGKGKEEPDGVLGCEKIDVDLRDEVDPDDISEIDSDFMEEEEIESVKSNDEVDHSQKLKSESEIPNNEEVLVLQRSIRLILNCVSETQMAKSISKLIALFVDRPRSTVRQVLIEEIDILLTSFPLTRGQSVGWLQQELAACFVCCEARLHHIGDDSRLVAHFIEFFVSSRLPAPNVQLKESEGGALASTCLFVAYLYRFGAITGDLIVDLLEEFLKRGDLLALQISHQIVKPISSVLRREMHERCSAFVNSAKAIISEQDLDFEKSVELEGIVSNLSSKHSKEPALSSADHFLKSIKSWNKGISFPKELRLPLRLEELRNVKKGKGRWWAVGSAFSGDALTSSDPLCAATNPTISSKKAVTLTPELKEIAQRLGLITPMRQQLFAILVSTPGGPDSAATALLEAVGSGGGGANSKGTDHREREVVQIVIHCLISEQPFNRFYTRVLGNLLNHHRRFTMMVRCAFWDVMSKEELTKEAKCNAGKALGILASVYDFPLTLLKKFNFGDESEANVGLLSALVTELASAEFKKTLEKFAHVASDNPRLGRNLRIFMRRLNKTHPDEACRSYLSRLVSDLRDLFP
nr:nucleolar MIF4G domain containing protein 1 [Hymenolepis microstoma]